MRERERGVCGCVHMCACVYYGQDQNLMFAGHPYYDSS